ncbi:MutS-related protein [Hymenobacter persicinus]|uniref:DNA mismatch repair protein MutS n=1 Tax=Hymenobacter persicinus TaxID=2025506 RepID=A0A4Q5LFX5_9BACT|nr:DNA mismatch repair protein MutS [Hymenobacter persicinus]RYU84314.1 DNA mismatch repair protein MutS [Hymenobacter persicinus]
MPVSAAVRSLSIAPADVFTENLTVHTDQEKHFAGRHQLGGWLRVLLFGLGAAGAWGLFTNGQIGAGIGFLAAVWLAFWLLVRWHSRMHYQREHHRLLAQLNQEELRRLSGQLSGFDGGLRYLDAQHAYAADLDVFGAQSLFQLLNRATTRLGHDWLAGWLLAPAAAPEVVARQQAAAELAPETSWRQEWQARARHFPHQQADPRAFSTWLARPDYFADKPWLKPMLVLLPLLLLAAIGAGVLGLGYRSVAFVVLAISLFNGRFGAIRAEYGEQALAMRDALRATQAQLAWFEDDTEQDWQAPRLRELRARLRTASHGTAATVRLGRLATVAGMFSVREHPLALLLTNSLLLWDLHAMWQLERWKRHLGPELTTVLEVQAELEALVSLAGFQFANPAYAVPTLSPEPLEVTAEALGHPLIFSAGRTTNDFHTAGYGRTGVITGSNMSGKSTFLRTVGLNMVLALAGGVVCARRLHLSPARVYSAMRTQDNLAESTSSFYAELKRLRLLLELTAGPAAAGAPTTPPEFPVFYLLDEILKGTNSRDRHRGARALIRQLHRRPASGLISTHDLELAAMADELPGAVTNYSFNSVIEGDRILFDYHLTPGVCGSFNASKLMQLMGIDLEDDHEA